MYNFQVPRSFEGKTYKQLFQYLISKRSVLSLGLYRSSPTDDVSPMPYVITNPDPDLLLNSQDMIFALLDPESIGKAPLGDVVVAVIEAQLPPRSIERNGHGPYVPQSVSCLIESEGETAMTDCCANVELPHWNFLCSFSIFDRAGSIEFTILDSGRLSQESFLGKVVVPLDEIISDDVDTLGRLNKSEKNDWFSLSGRHCDGMQANGMLHLQLCFNPGYGESNLQF